MGSVVGAVAGGAVGSVLGAVVTDGGVSVLAVVYAGAAAQPERSSMARTRADSFFIGKPPYYFVLGYVYFF